MFVANIHVSGELLKFLSKIKEKFRPMSYTHLAEQEKYYLG
jgi:hypothetical protein